MHTSPLKIDARWLGALGAGTVLYVAEPTAFHAPLCPALERRAFAVIIRTGLAEALDAVREAEPTCIVVDVDMKEGLGLEIARALRAHAALRRIPLACLASDSDARVSALQAGADAALAADAGPDASAAQVEALVRAAGRLDHHAAFRVPPPHALAGDGTIIPLPTLLLALGHERRTGVVEVVAEGSNAHLEIVDGRAVAGSIGGERVIPLDALRAALGWRDVRFAFTALPLHAPPEDAHELSALCVEAVRLMDESRHAGAA